ncbi:putative membrane protein [Corynebacterium deserti GIMN1.010]|uniref:Putative membrane protein n=1 Tax=Corynebacterium deserti GIMN1.010 TaxID=931089 RepID=A0A0M4CW66_9CORY|nr:hypothetical protein [Corynebacterium deserti]ALC04982.1 putative membrane protein [Corynebacterium deserti GIMN1.010]
MWKLSLGIIIGGILFSLGIWATHAATNIVVIAGWVGIFASIAVWLYVIWRAAVGNVKSPF